MNKFILSALVITGFMLQSFEPITPHTSVYKIDKKASKLEWYAEKLTGKHNGTINFSAGEIHDNHGTLTGSAEADMKTIKDLDLQDENYRTKLEVHLKSADFFDAEKYPTSNIVIQSVTPLSNPKPGEATHAVKGRLTIKDKTNDIAFNAVVKTEPGSIKCTGSLVIDRSKYDVRYGSKTFFADIGDKVIYDDFTLKFHLVAVSQNTH